jgi:hypothetical protein
MSSVVVGKGCAWMVLVGDGRHEGWIVVWLWVSLMIGDKGSGREERVGKGCALGVQDVIESDENKMIKGYIAIELAIKNADALRVRPRIGYRYRRTCTKN